MNESTIGSAITAHPEIAAVAVLILGIVLGRLGQWMVQRATVGLSNRFASTLTPRFNRGAGLFVFWAITITAMFIALRLLGVAELSDWLQSALNLIPRLFVAIAIIGVGHLLGIVVGDLLRRIQSHSSAATMLPQLGYAAVLLVAVITAAKHLGIDVSFIAQLALTLLTVILGALALAFALGSRHHVANLIAGSDLTSYHAGDRLRVGTGEQTFEGPVVEIRRTSIVLATDDGRVVIPASQLNEHPVVVLSNHPDH